jgi:glycosyltransferase involved in cell wall biosynthesis
MDLSVIIPARNEMFLTQTIESVLANARADTEVIVIADGAWPLTPIPQHERVQVVYHPESVGQRAATNEGAAISLAKYIMKLDAHCIVDEGFDVKLMADCAYDWTVIPRMYNLHAFDWLCKDCGHRRYQGPTAPCEQCGSTNLERDLVWQPRWSRVSDFMRFDSTMHFQYWGSYKSRPAAHDDVADLMTSVGACFFMHRDRFWDLGGMDTGHGSWGQFGVEVACKAWLSGGRHVVNKKTWFAHMFRTQGGDFSFPYHLSGSQVDHARKYSRDLWMNNRWPKAVRPFSWILDHFKPVPTWHDDQGNLLVPVTPDVTPEQHVPAPSTAVTTTVTERARWTPATQPATPTKGLLYYTDNRLDDSVIGTTVRQLLSFNNLPIVSVSLQPLNFHQNIVLHKERGYLTMFEQILAGLSALHTDVVFFCEHDVLYHPSHFAFTPAARDVYYYNLNVWKVDATSGHALHYITKQTSGLCAYRDILLEHYTERVRRVKADGFSRGMGFEPGSHGRKERVDDRGSESWTSAYPNVDVRHDKNLTASRWRQDQFRDQRNCRGWQEAAAVPGWGRSEGRFQAWLTEDIPAAFNLSK